MEHIIYKYTSKTSKKSYIGQTNNFDRRHKQHIRDSFYKDKGHEVSYSLPFHCAIRKYGIDDFTVEILEVKDFNSWQEVNDRESYWIKVYNTIAPNGYNLQAQGFANEGKNKTKIPKEVLGNIYNDLLHSPLNMTELTKQYDISLSVLSDINKGRTGRRQNTTYPLRRTRTISYKEYIEIIRYIKDTNYSFESIARFFHRSGALIQDINKGRQSKVHKVYNGTFPIRKNARVGYVLKPVETISSEIESTPVIGT